MFNFSRNDVVEVVVHWTWNAQKCINVWHFSGIGQAGWAPGASSTSTELLARVQAILAGSFETLQVDTCTLDFIDARLLNGYKTTRPFTPGVTPMSFTYFQTDTDVGGYTGDVVTASLPSYCAVTGRKYSGLAGRSYRGSCRIPGIPEIQSDTAADANFLTGAAETAWGLAWLGIAGTPFATDPPGAPVNNNVAMNIASLKIANAIYPVPAGADGPVLVPIPDFVSISNPVFQVEVNRYLGSQVSRKIHRGG